MAIHHERHLDNKTQRIFLVNIPVVAEFCHIVLEAAVVIRIVVAFSSVPERVGIGAALFARLHLVGIELREVKSGIGFLGAIVQVQREHIHILPFFDIAKIHASIGGTEETIQPLHHIALEFDIDDTARPRRIVLGGRIGDNLNFLYRVAVRAFKHRLQLLTAQVGRTPINIDSHRFAIYCHIAILIHIYAGGFLQNIFAIATCRKRRIADIEYQLIELSLHQGTLAADFYLA